VKSNCASPKSLAQRNKIYFDFRSRCFPFVKLISVHCTSWMLQEVFMDVSVGGEAVGRIVIGLFGNIVPKTVDNFAALASKPQVPVKRRLLL
jgi:hypothetical protein